MTQPIKVKVQADELGLPGNRHHCAIANAIMLADPDIVNVRVDEDRIKFSRRSTQTRYEYATPAPAARFIHEFDSLVQPPDTGGRVRKMAAKPFTLELTPDHLLGERPRRTRNAAAAVQRAAAKLQPATAKPKKPRRVEPRRRPSQRVAS